MRATLREPQTLEAVFGGVELARGTDPRLDAAVKEAKESFADTATIEFRARRVAERLALVLQASLLVRYGHPAVADAFCASRLGGDWGGVFGTLPPGLDLAPLIERATPKLG
ncbi:hypothetical protein [Actinomadura gamaensis]|uniref:Uncharacterized protein n=1 Tax=Actinomadura gamaensis TaxID=1763541 RepID=A0ABV9TU19_9ACTN